MAQPYPPTISVNNYQVLKENKVDLPAWNNTVCPGSLVQFLRATHWKKMDKTSWTHGIRHSQKLTRSAWSPKNRLNLHVVYTYKKLDRYISTTKKYSILPEKKSNINIIGLKVFQR